jgi:hypothetical protein
MTCIMDFELYQIELAELWKRGIEALGHKAEIVKGYTKNYQYASGSREVLEVVSDYEFSTEEARESLRINILLIRYGSWDNVPAYYR